jgi:murein L,D-transpeptidase YcbB/YkuD
MDTLYPGDLLFLPSRTETLLEFKKGTTNTYVASVPRITVRIAFEDDDGPYAGEDFVVEETNPPIEGTTDNDGIAEFMLPYTIKKAKVHLLERKEVFIVDIGHLDPVNTASGVRQRLSQLGYLPQPCPVTDAGLAKRVLTYEMEQALREFQRDNGIEENGTVDQATRDALVEAFGS